MGGSQATQPLLGKEGMRRASFDSRFGSRQQPRGSSQGFDPVVQALSVVFSPFGHSRRLNSRRLGHRVSTSLHPFAPPALPGFLARMGALTPERPALRFPRAHEHRLECRPGLPALRVWPSDHSASNHPACPTIALTRYPSASWASGSLRSGLRLSLAGSPHSKAESSSLALRTGRSPPVASHPLSRGRSYVQLQAGERVPEEDSHLSDQTRLQAH